MDHHQAPTPSDAACIEASLVHPDAFEAVFRRHHATVHAYLARRSDRSTADDLAGEVFCRAFRARDRFDLGRTSAIPWLIGFARNLLHERRRASAREHRHLRRAALDPTVSHIRDHGSDDRISADPIGQPGAGLERADGELDRVRKALARLPQQQTEPLLLFAWERLTYDQIAEVLGLPVGTVRSRIARCRGRLVELLADSSQETCETAPHRKAMP